MLATFYDISIERAFTLLAASKTGLSDAEAASRISRYGYNELPKVGGPGIFSLFVSQFRNFLIILLLFAVGLSVFLGEFIEAGAMLSIVLLSALLGFVQEFRAERAMEALERISAPTARVVRSGRELKIAARELVPGDVLVLEAGDIVPSDSRMFESFSMQIDEAALTGESLPSLKVTVPFKGLCCKKLPT